MADMNIAGALSGFAAALGPVGGALVGFGVGVLVGLFHFRSLWWNTQAYANGGSPFRALALHLLRFAILVVLLAGLAELGALPLLAGALGVFASRAYVLRRVGGVS